MATKTVGMKNSFTGFISIAILFVLWRLILFVVAYIGFKLLPFGYAYPYWDTTLQITNLPEWVWGWGGFDGVHYLRLAQNGYGDAFTQAFFPVFPQVLSAFAFLFPKMASLDLARFVDPAYFIAGLVFANLATLALCFALYKLFKLDNKKTALFNVFLMLIFPTSFYLGAIYTESLFLLLCVLSLYCARKGNFLSAGVFAGLASATRITGLFLLVPLLWEFWQLKKRKLQEVIGLMLAPLGTMSYMLYLGASYGDPLLFLTAQPGFGAGRSASLVVTLPQVLVRYGKILLSVPHTSYQFFSATLELWFVGFVAYVLFFSYKTARRSYWWFVLLATLAPTLTGTFLSMPRFALVVVLLLPGLTLVGIRRAVYIGVSVIMLVLLSMLFVRGYWVA